MKYILCTAMILTSTTAFGQTIQQLNEKQLRQLTKSIVIEPTPIEVRLTGEYRPPLKESATNFHAFVREQITILKREFKLDEKAVRKLQVASKGVLRRSKLAREEATSRPVVDTLGQVVLRLRLPEVRVDRTAEFRIELHKSVIWEGSLGKVLTDKQRLLWIDHHVFPLRGIMKQLRVPPVSDQ